MSRKKKIVKTILMAFVLIIGIAGVGIYFMFSKFDSMAKAEHYEIGDENVPSLAMAVGYRKINGYSTRITTEQSNKTYSYTSDDTAKDVLAYVRYLVTEEDFVLLTSIDPNQPTGIAKLAKPASEEGKIILVELQYGLGDLTLSLARGKGTLTRYSDTNNDSTEEV